MQIIFVLNLALISLAYKSVRRTQGSSLLFTTRKFGERMQSLFLTQDGVVITKRGQVQFRAGALESSKRMGYVHFQIQQR